MDVDGTKKLGGECGIATFECCTLLSGGENWQKEGTISYKLVNKGRYQEIDNIFPCNIASFGWIMT